MPRCGWRWRICASRRSRWMARDVDVEWRRRAVEWRPDAAVDGVRTLARVVLEQVICAMANGSHEARDRLPSALALCRARALGADHRAAQEASALDVPLVGATACGDAL